MSGRRVNVRSCIVACERGMKIYVNIVCMYKIQGHYFVRRNFFFMTQSIGYAIQQEFWIKISTEIRYYAHVYPKYLCLYRHTTACFYVKSRRNFDFVFYIYLYLFLFFLFLGPMCCCTMINKYENCDDRRHVLDTT